MGCWNKTCGLTNLPIFANDEIVWFLLVQTPTIEARTSYANGQWELIPVPIYGVYDDYGFIEPHDGQEWKLNLFKKHFEKSLVKLNDGGYGELVTEPFASFEMLNNCLRNDSYAVKNTSFANNSRTEVQCLFADFFVHKDTFDELTAQYQRPWGDETFTREQIEANLEKFYHWKELKTAEYEKLLETDPKNMDIRVNLMCLNRAQMRGDELEAFVATLDTKSEYSHHYCGSNVVSYWNGDTGSEVGYQTREFIMSMTAYGTNKNVLSVKEQVDVALLHNVVGGLRKQFTPCGHEGSQDGIWELHEQFARTYQQRITDYNEKYAEDT
jgi:hypothetical protein